MLGLVVLILAEILIVERSLGSIVEPRRLGSVVGFFRVVGLGSLVSTGSFVSTGSMVGFLSVLRLACVFRRAGC